jgi:hypothetical protein
VTPFASSRTSMMWSTSESFRGAPPNSRTRGAHPARDPARVIPQFDIDPANGGVVVANKTRTCYDYAYTGGIVEVLSPPPLTDAQEFCCVPPRMVTIRNVGCPWAPHLQYNQVTVTVVLPQAGLPVTLATPTSTRPTHPHCR